MDPETDFLSGLIELQYGQDVEDKLRQLSEKVKWAKDWPENKEAFWNAESFMWQCKINKEKRELIKKELSFLENGNNLDLGCGAYSYISSVGFDISEKMLQLNDNCVQKIVGDLENALPFNDQEFDSVTAIFVLNYVKDYQQLLSEIKRVLSKRGFFVMVISSKGVNDWQQQKEVNDFSVKEWGSILERIGFKVRFYEKHGLCFFICKV